MKDFIGLCPLLTSLKTFSVRSSTQNLSIRFWWLHVRGQSVQGLIKSGSGKLFKFHNRSGMGRWYATLN